MTVESARDAQTTEDALAKLLKIVGDAIELCHKARQGRNSDTISQERAARGA